MSRSRPLNRGAVRHARRSGEGRRDSVPQSAVLRVVEVDEPLPPRAGRRAVQPVENLLRERRAFLKALVIGAQPVIHQRRDDVGVASHAKETVLVAMERLFATKPREERERVADDRLTAGEAVAG